MNWNHIHPVDRSIFMSDSTADSMSSKSATLHFIFIAQLRRTILRTEPGIRRRGNRDNIEEECSVHEAMVSNAVSPCTEIERIYTQNIETACSQCEYRTHGTQPVAPLDNMFFHCVLRVVQFDLVPRRLPFASDRSIELYTA